MVTVLLVVASQYHFWSRLSSGSVFAPEFPRPVVLLFNWAFAAIFLLAPLQLLLDCGTLLAMAVHGGSVFVPDGIRYAIGAVAAVVAAIGVQQAVRVPPLRDIEIGIPGLAPQFDGYRMLHLTDLHISRLFPTAWARAVVERANDLGADLIVVTGDLIDGSLASRRADVESAARSARGGWCLCHPRQPRILLRLSRLDGALRRHGDARAGERSRGAQARWRPAGAGRRHRSVGTPHRQPCPGPRRCARGRAAAWPSSCSITSRGRRAVRPRKAWHCNCPGTPTAAWWSGSTGLTARANAGYVSGRYDVDGMTLYVNNGTGLWPGFRAAAPDGRRS